MTAKLSDVKYVEVVGSIGVVLMSDGSCKILHRSVFDIDLASQREQMAICKQYRPYSRAKHERA